VGRVTELPYEILRGKEVIKKKPEVGYRQDMVTPLRDSGEKMEAPQGGSASCV